MCNCKSLLHLNVQLLLDDLAAHLCHWMTSHYPAQVNIVQRMILFLLLECPSRVILFSHLVALNHCCCTVHIFLLFTKDCDDNNSYDLWDQKNMRCYQVRESGDGKNGGIIFSRFIILATFKLSSFHSSSQNIYTRGQAQNIMTIESETKKNKIKMAHVIENDTTPETLIEKILIQMKQILTLLTEEY